MIPIVVPSQVLFQMFLMGIKNSLHSLGEEAMVLLHVDNIKFESALASSLKAKVEPIRVSFGVDIALEDEVILQDCRLLVFTFEDSEKVAALEP